MKHVTLLILECFGTIWAVACLASFAYSASLITGCALFVHQDLLGGANSSLSDWPIEREGVTCDCAFISVHIQWPNWKSIEIHSPGGALHIT